MKKMTCMQLGGACDMEFQAETFEEMATLSRQHGANMFQQGDTPHLRAMDEMKELMKSEKALEQWFDDKRALFNSLPNL